MHNPTSHDWSIPTDVVTLMRRVLPERDQSRYGRCTDSPRFRADGHTSWPRVNDENKGDRKK